MDLAEFAAAAAHVVAAGVWLGAMVYSLFVVQPRAREYLRDQRRNEEFAATLASGARYPVLVAIAVIAASGAVLTALLADGGRSTGWWVLIAAKAIALAAALGVFALVSWHLWPRRLFATDAELPAIKRRFGAAALTLVALAAAGTILGAAASAL